MHSVGRLSRAASGIVLLVGYHASDGLVCVCMVQGTQSARADDESDTRPTIGEEGSTLRLTTTEGRLKPRTHPESQPHYLLYS